LFGLQAKAFLGADRSSSSPRRPPVFAYADNYLVDVKFGVIVDVEASRAIRQAPEAIIRPVFA
jgi:hypothetical protein